MFTGSIVALITPFRDGQVDVAALRGLVKWHIDNGTQGLVPVGTTGEAPALSQAEHEQVVEIVAPHSSCAMPTMVYRQHGSGCGGATYTTFFSVVEPTSEPTAPGRATGTRFTITDVFFHTIVESSAYSSSFCAFVSWSSMLRSPAKPFFSAIWRFRSPTLMNIPSNPSES